MKTKNKCGDLLIFMRDWLENEKHPRYLGKDLRGAIRARIYSADVFSLTYALFGTKMLDTVLWADIHPLIHNASRRVAEGMYRRMSQFPCPEYTDIVWKYVKVIKSQMLYMVENCRTFDDYRAGMDMITKNTMHAHNMANRETYRTYELMSVPDDLFCGPMYVEGKMRS